MVEKIKNLDKKTLLYLGIGGGSIILLIVLLIVLKLIVGNRVNSKQFESRLKKAAISYYEKYPDKLPQTSGNKIVITIDELVKSGDLKSLDKLLDKGLTCEGNVNISNNNGQYLYQPVIKCSDDYKTSLLYQKVLEDNPAVTSGSGLYKIDNYNLFRGEDLNNYVKFSNMNFQILRINEDNTIRMLLIDNIDSTSWDDRYNVQKQDYVGKNDYSISRIKDVLASYFNGNDTFTDEAKALIVPQNLCIGARSENATINNGSIECAKKYENQPLGLLQLNEYMLASIEPTCKNIYDNQCTNYNYLANINNLWTITPNSSNTYQVYKIAGYVYSNNASIEAQPKFVITLSSDTLFSKGSGTEEDPYIVES